jgi:hypothetical protein
MALVCFLFVEELRFDLLKLRQNVRVVGGKLTEKRKIHKSLFGLATIDEVARCFWYKRDHDALQSTGDKLNS